MRIRRISGEEYVVVVTERELYTLFYCIQHRLYDSIDHCRRHYGMATLQSNYGDSELVMLRDIANRLGRIDLYEDAMAYLEKEITAEKSKEGNEQ